MRTRNEGGFGASSTQGATRSFADTQISTHRPGHAALPRVSGTELAGSVDVSGAKVAQELRGRPMSAVERATLDAQSVALTLRGFGAALSSGSANQVVRRATQAQLELADKGPRLSTAAAISPKVADDLRAQLATIVTLTPSRLPEFSGQRRADVEGALTLADFTMRFLSSPAVIAERYHLGAAVCEAVNGAVAHACRLLSDQNSEAAAILGDHVQQTTLLHRLASSNVGDPVKFVLDVTYVLSGFVLAAANGKADGTTLDRLARTRPSQEALDALALQR